jgi:hypothetical protein
MAATGAQGLAVVAFLEGSSTLTLYAMLSHGGDRCARAGMAGGLLDTQIVCNAVSHTVEWICRGGDEIYYRCSAPSRLVVRWQ